MANLSSLDSNILEHITGYLPESNQASLRQINHYLHDTLNTEELWRKKCSSLYPASVKHPHVTWRDHFISCYIENLPYNVAFRAGRQAGRNLAPCIMAGTGLIAFIYYWPASVIFTLRNLNFLLENFDMPRSVNSISFVCFGTMIPLFQIKTAYLVTRVFYNSGSTQIGRNICGSILGNISYYHAKWFKR